MELVVRLHRIHRLAGKPYRIRYVPDPVCWTEAPESLGILRNQRIRWQRGLGESLSRHRVLLGHPKGGLVGWLAYPYFLVFEWLGVILEATGLLYSLAAVASGLVPPRLFLLFLAASIGMGMVLSLMVLVLEEIWFHTYPRWRDLGVLLLAVIVENLGYRQLNAWWRLQGLWQWARGKQGGWGEMRRSGSWAQSPPHAPEVRPIEPHSGTHTGADKHG
jgi:cellulose synthase/poly-beta-1,6-N-acetylglucosamine synthase-like glycosyltransferase